MESWHVIAYDVACARRLRRVHRYLLRYALAVQRSVFLFHGTPDELARVLAGLERLIDTRKDDVRTYPVHETASARSHVLARSGGSAGPDAPFTLYPLNGITARLRMFPRRGRGRRTRP